MRRRQNTLVLAILASLCLSTPTVFGGEYQGTVRAGYIFTDLEGNRGVHQPTYNLYEGVALSLERFRYRWDNGMQLAAHLVNPTLNNRNLRLSWSKIGLAAANMRHNSYRRTYDFEGANFTRRRATSGSAWIRPVKLLKLYGGYGLTEKRGNALTFFESVGSSVVKPVDYLHHHFHVGAELKHKRHYGRFEYRVSDFSDDLNGINDRSSRRLRLTVYSPLPLIEQIVLGGGFQHFENTLDHRLDTLSSNTVWSVARYTHKHGYQVRYSFMFDRSDRTGDLTATDNILQTIRAGKTWKGRGGFLLGYGNRINDDVYDERSGNEYSFSGWLIPLQRLKVTGGLGSADDNVESGRTLTGNREYTRHWLSARYRFASGFVDLRFDDRQRSNDDIGSNVDFVRASGDLFLTDLKYGELAATYSFGDGEYTNSSGVFGYREHVVSGDAISKEYRRIKLGFGGSYYRAQHDVDVEAFSIRITGRYRIIQKAVLEVIYSAHNFDNLDDLAAPYTKYYTANVVEACLLFEL